MTLEEQKKKFAAPFATNLRELMKEQKVTATALARDLEISRQAVNQYMEGTGQPNAEKLTRIADYFNVSVDWLLGRSGGVKTVNADLEAAVKYTGLSADAAVKICSVKGNADLLTALNKFLTQKSFWDALEISIERKELDSLARRDFRRRFSPPQQTRTAPEINDPMYMVVSIDKYDYVLENKIIELLKSAIGPL